MSWNITISKKYMEIYVGQHSCDPATISDQKTAPVGILSPWPSWAARRCDMHRCGSPPKNPTVDHLFKWELTPISSVVWIGKLGIPKVDGLSDLSPVLGLKWQDGLSQLPVFAAVIRSHQSIEVGWFSVQSQNPHRPQGLKSSIILYKSTMSIHFSALLRWKPLVSTAHPTWPCYRRTSGRPLQRQRLPWRDPCRAPCPCVRMLWRPWSCDWFPSGRFFNPWKTLSSEKRWDYFMG